ncbi:hypothetical protein [Oceanidesulfovibrio marinus]|uniref:Uncharacterized protein n=1 Tax=Oceanidesulfovibrio marinus TaxID=370038 RepID=A0ABX6NHF5_9BACT|nr:hypothetical protein [Oceanidesulfovibrio marinus]QJT09488.1 hypothetical protein E8L03_11295 [Oceanidesulfovibrio marinus]
MARNDCRVYVALQYSQEISYHELHEVEQELIVVLQDTLIACGAVHLDFWGYGDSLQFDFSMERFEKEALKEMAQEIAGLLPADVSGRLVGVDKALRRLGVFNLTPGEARGSILNIADIPLDGLFPPRSPHARPN